MSQSEPTPSMEGFVSGMDGDALRVVRRLLSAGHEAYLVGGCVRDLYLGRPPKDFDVATSATPEAIRKLFRNSRIIGRRFKLVHVFFGHKIIETSTFRTTPPDTGNEDLLITHDNEWGTIEDDARRRDFTINGLFYDVENERIVDFVDGISDLESRIIRTIGEPATRFREDPVRMIRAIKFAARLGFHFEPATWQALLEVAPDITKCSKARVLEEIYKLLRSGSSLECFALLLESGLLQATMPHYVALFGRDPEDGGEAILQAIRQPDEASPEASTLARFLAALDDYTLQTRQIVANGVLQAVLFAPVLGDALTTASRDGLDRHIDALMAPVSMALGIARRDRELARQILMAHRRMIEPFNRRRRASIAQRQYFHDALIFLGLAVSASGDRGRELERWRRLADGSPEPESGRAPSAPEKAGKRNRRKRNHRRVKGAPASAARPPAAASDR